MEADAGKPLRLAVGESGVAELVIDRPARGNSFTTAMWAQLPTLLEAAQRDGARVLILRSAHERIFASGVDLDELIAMLDDAALRRRHWRAMTAATAALAAAPFVTIAEIAGAAAGAGLSLALACDLRLAAPSARFVLPPAKLGVIYPRADLARLVRLAGEAAARELLLTAAPRDAGWAQAHGLVQTVCPDRRALQEAALHMARDIAGLSAPSLAALKESLDALAGTDGGMGADEVAAEEERFVRAFDEPEVRARITAAQRRSRGAGRSGDSGRGRKG